MKKTFSILLIPFLFTCCNKVKNQLPTLVHTGENILACYVNGSPLIISGHQTNGGIVNTIDGTKFINSNPFIQIDAYQTNAYEIGFVIRFADSVALGSYNFSDTAHVFPSQSYGYYYNLNQTASYHYLYYQTNATYSGTVNISYFDGKIVAGTFSFDALDSGNVVHITDGEFDINVN